MRLLFWINRKIIDFFSFTCFNRHLLDFHINVNRLLFMIVNGDYRKPNPIRRRYE
jgi:hypothetical protein